MIHKVVDDQTNSLIWDGFNIIQVLTHTQTHTLTNSFIWGLDLSGTLQGAGGVGGLLAEIKDGTPYFAAFDANGNVTEYVSTNGTLAAHYEYSPFGEIVVQSGDMADAFTHRFSTKPWCEVTGMSEYELRMYNPGLGRWLSREPLGETFSGALYGFLDNKAVNRLDVLGFYAFDMHFYAVYVALVKAGNSKDEAWLLAYWSATPDIDPRHGAMSGGIIRDSLLSYGWEAAAVQQLLHQLNGMKGENIEKMRCCLRDLYKKSNEPVVKGYALHALGDTYGHMVAETYGGVSGFHSSVFTHKTLDELYGAPVGHFFDFTMSDRASLRPDQAEKYLRDLSSLVGVSVEDTTDLVEAMRNDLNPEGTTIAAATENWRKYIHDDEKLAFPDYAAGWDPGKGKRLVDRRTTKNMRSDRFYDTFVRPLKDCLEAQGIVLPF
jgi:RHS repeat-associated protein